MCTQHKLQRQSLINVTRRQKEAKKKGKQKKENLCTHIRLHRRRETNKKSKERKNKKKVFRKPAFWNTPRPVGFTYGEPLYERQIAKWVLFSGFPFNWGNMCSFCQENSYPGDKQKHRPRNGNRKQGIQKINSPDGKVLLQCWKLQLLRAITPSAKSRCYIDFSLYSVQCIAGPLIRNRDTGPGYVSSLRNWLCVPH